MVFNRNIKGAASAAAGCNSVISTGLPGDPPPTPNLDTLYPDMTREIFSNLPLADIGRCARVCRSLRIRRLSVKQQSSTPPPLPVPQLPPRQIERSYPPVSLVDSCVLKRGAFRSVYGKGKWFLDDEIITVHGIVGQEEIKDGQTGPSRRPIYAKKSENGKYVIQQQAIRGCTAATAAMLIKDHGGNPNAFQLTRRNLGNIEAEMRDIREAGLRPILRTSSDLNSLKSLLEQHGSAIVYVHDEDLGAHVIVVDEITDEGVRLRDPYHGWEITVTVEAFKKHFSKGNVIQI